MRWRRRQHHEHLRRELADTHRRNTVLENEIAWLRRRNDTLVERLDHTMRARLAVSVRMDELAGQVRRLENQQRKETA